MRKLRDECDGIGMIVGGSNRYPVTIRRGHSN